MAVSDAYLIWLSLQEKRNENLFLDLIKHPQCKVVVCARLAPKQKANVVDLVKVRFSAHSKTTCFPL